eukprot:1318518-Prymnesium_polylepis.1
MCVSRRYELEGHATWQLHGGHGMSCAAHSPALRPEPDGSTPPQSQARAKATLPLGRRLRAFCAATSAVALLGAFYQLVLLHSYGASRRRAESPRVTIEPGALPQDESPCADSFGPTASMPSQTSRTSLIAASSNRT